MTTKQPVSPPKQRKLTVRLCGDHVHAGRIGTVVNDIDGDTVFVNENNEWRVMVHFGVGEWTYATAKQIEAIAPTSPPPPRKMQ
jgi:hypothetical protein